MNACSQPIANELIVGDATVKELAAQHPERFSPFYAMRRVRAFVRRAVWTGSAPANGG